MFCKWCGDSLTPSDRKCSRCGKEVSALSDCGGFYDLVPGAKKPPVSRRSSEHIPADAGKESVRSTVREQDTGNKAAKPRQRGVRALTVLALCSVALVLVLLFMMHLQSKRYSEEIRRLQDKLRETSSETQPGSTTAPEETTPAEAETTAPEETTPAQAETTAPEETTPAQAETTAPEETTPAD